MLGANLCRYPDPVRAVGVLQTDPKKREQQLDRKRKVADKKGLTRDSPEWPVSDTDHKLMATKA